MSKRPHKGKKTPGGNKPKNNNPRAVSLGKSARSSKPRKKSRGMKIGGNQKPAAIQELKSPTLASPAVSPAPLAPNEPDPLDLSIDELFERSFSHEARDPAERPKWYIELDEDHPEDDPTGEALARTEAAINEEARNSAELGGPEKEHVLAISPSAIPHDAENFTGLKEAIVQDVGTELEKRAKEVRAERSATEELRRAGKLTRAATASAARAARKSAERAHEVLCDNVIQLHVFSMRCYSEAGCAWDAIHPDRRGFVINIAAAIVYEAVKSLT